MEMRVLRPAEHVLAFYDGRVEGYRFAEQPNWVDEGGLSLGIASYAILDGDSALVYDTHVSVEHAAFVRERLEEEGVREFTVLLSHWHLDHVAGTTVFPDAEVVSSDRTAEHLIEKRSRIEAGTLEGPPAIDPLVLPSRTYSGRETLRVGGFEVELIEVNIHSDDATVLWLAGERLLLCGDTMEDTVTYVDEPGQFDSHLADLARLRELGPERILPNHGDPEVIAAGGYPAGLIDATEEYIGLLRRCVDEPALRDADLRELLAGPLEAGWIRWFEPYEEVHRSNVATVVADGATS